MMQGPVATAGAGAAAAAVVFDRKDRIKELSKFISPQYVDLAFDLPPACGTFWGLMEEEIDKFASRDAHPFSKDVDDILGFLGLFFSTDLVQRIGDNMDALQKSFLGSAYTLRPGKAMLAMTVLHDVHLECDSVGRPLHGFIGNVDYPLEGDAHDVDGAQQNHDGGEDADGGWQSQGFGCPFDSDAGGDGGWQHQRRRHRQSSGGSHSGGSNVGPVAGGSGGAGRGMARGAGRGLGRGAGGGRGNREGRTPTIHFDRMDRETIFVPMSAFPTPPYGDPDRRQTLKSRSWEFVSHALVGEHREELYHPQFSESGKVFLFHGTRSSSFTHFQRKGIAPRYRRNEFSMEAAFYVSNSLRQAYEHPLHYHPSRNISDPISVLVFELDVHVLHGLEPPPRERSPLSHLWFVDSEEDEPAWRHFCKENFEGQGSGHSSDIVIGPVCLPRDEDDYGKLRVSLPDDAPLTQIAFCSARARAWLERSFKRVYAETRG